MTDTSDLGGDPACWSHLFDAPEHDVRDCDDVEQLVRSFYRRAATDDVLGPVFESAGVDWSVHIPKLVAFWSWQLFGVRGYEGTRSERTRPYRRPLPSVTSTTGAGSSSSRRPSTSCSPGQPPRWRRRAPGRWPMLYSGCWPEPTPQETLPSRCGSRRAEAIGGRAADGRGTGVRPRVTGQPNAPPPRSEGEPPPALRR